MDKIFLHQPVADLVNGVDRISSVKNEYAFLFVRIDSGEIEDFSPFIESTIENLDLGESQQVFKLSEFGLLIKGDFVVEVLLGHRFPPRFNACYILRKAELPRAAAEYIETSETDNFSSLAVIPKTLKESIHKLQASGYMADGAGLNVYLVDKSLVDVWKRTDWGEGNPHAN